MNLNQIKFIHHLRFDFFLYSIFATLRKIMHIHVYVYKCNQNKLLRQTQLDRTTEVQP